MQSTTSPPGRLRDPRVLAALLFLTVTVAFLPALKNDFISYDDPLFVTENPVAQRGWTAAGLKWAFTSVVAANWHPVTCLSHLTDCQLFGLKPWGHHLTNVLLHAANAVLLFLLLQGMTGAMWRSLFAAAFFGLHPLRVESVAWVAERKDVLSAFFLLLTLMAYARYAASNRKTFYALALALFALGLMSKAMLVTTPCVLLLLDYWPLKRLTPQTVGRLLAEKIPFLVLTAAACVVTLRAQGGHGAIAPSERFGLGTRAANALVSYARYVELTFWPHDLALPYPYIKHWSLAVVAGAAGLLLLVSVAVIAIGALRPYAPVGWFWFLGTLVPVIGLVQVGEQALADRYTYIPSIGLALVIAWGVSDLLEKAVNGRAILTAAAMLTLSLCALMTQRQLSYWQTSETLFSHAMAVTKNNATAMGLVADAMAARGDTADAMALYEKAIALNLSNESSRNNYGLLLLHQGRTKEAVAEFDAAAALAPNGARAHLNRGLDLQRQGLANEAEKEFAQAQALNQNDAAVENNLGVMCAHDGQSAEATNHFHRALLLNPADGSAWANIGQVALREGQTNEAIAAFERAVALEASLTFARDQLKRLRP